MAEPTNEEKEQLATIFATAYNRENATSYKWEDEKSLTPEEPYDFRLFEGQRVLGVQMIRGAVADTDKAYARPKYATKVVDQLRAVLQTREMPSVDIYLNFPNPPKKREQTDLLAQDLADFIYTCSLKELPYFADEWSEDETFPSTIKDYVSDVSIASLPDGIVGFRITFSWASGKLEGAFDSEQKILGAVRRKEGKYDQVILLIDSVSWPVEDGEIPFIRDALVGSPIKEIWVVNNFVGNQKAMRVK
jgi:hypothetical protein